MKTLNVINMSADPDTVFRTAANVADWPRILPHYRWVKILGADVGGEIVEMAAKRSGIPVKWLSVMSTDSERRRIWFTHIGGLTRGMDVVWSIDSDNDGTRVSIVHELTLDVPIVRSFPGKIITGKVFVEHIADQTLRYMKEWVENKCDVRSLRV